MTFIEGQRVTLHHENRLHLDPEWVVVGVRLPNGEYAALAALGLTEATLTSRAKVVHDLVEDTGGQVTEELRAKIDSYVLGFGSSYAAAMADLVSRWNPDERKELPK